MALKLFENAEKLGIKCVIVDGGSNKTFLEKVSEYKNVELSAQTARGMGAGRREALSIASEEFSNPASKHFFLWVEPEKDGLITEENLSKMIESLREGNSDIVVPLRGEKGMDSLPRFQAWIEERANKKASQLIGKNVTEEEAEGVWDIWFGPKMFNQKGLKYFLEYKGELDKWDSVIKPVMEAYEGGAKIASVPVDFAYDESQKSNEENDRNFKMKRIEQYAMILSEMGDKFLKRKIEEYKYKKNENNTKR